MSDNEVTQFAAALNNLCGEANEAARLSTDNIHWG